MPLRHALFLILPMLAGCVPSRLAYMPEGRSGHMGYAEVQVASERFRVTYSAPRRTPVEQLDRLALRRAAELSLSRGYAFFEHRHRVVTRGVYVLPAPQNTRLTYRGGFGGWRRFWRFYCLGHGWKGCDEDPLWPSRSRPVERVEVAYTIDLLKERGPGPAAVDAAALLETQRAEDARRAAPR